MEKIKSQESELSDSSTEYKITPKKRPPVEPLPKTKKERSEKQKAHFARLQEINKKRRETARKVKTETQQQVEKVLNAKKILADHEATLSDGEKQVTKAKRVIENAKVSASLAESEISDIEDEEPIPKPVKVKPAKKQPKPPKPPKKPKRVIIEESSESDYTEESVYEEESVSSSSSSEEEVIVKRRKPKKQKEIRQPKQEAIKYNIPTETIYFA
jgi:hypothetical protein